MTTKIISDAFEKWLSGQVCNQLAVSSTATRT